MRNVLFTLFLLGFNALLFAQGVDFKWVRTFGSTGSDWGTALTLDAAGNIYATGQFAGTVDFDPGPGLHNLTAIGGADVFISKLDGNGNFIWVKQLGGLGEEKSLAIEIDNSGNLYYAGTFENVVDFDPGAGIYNLAASATAPAGFICKLTGGGNFLWAAKFNESHISGLSIDAANNIIAAGSFSGVTDFDPGPSIYNLTATGFTPFYSQSDILVLKLDAAGNFLWAKQMGSTGQDFAVSVDVDLAGNVYTTGGFSSNTDLDPGPAVYTVNTFQGTNFISKLDAAGDFIWGKTFGGRSFNGVYEIKIDGAGSIYTAGVSYTDGDFDPGPGVFMLNMNFSPASPGHIFVCKLNAAGDFEWARAMGGPISDFCDGLAVDAGGNVYTTGGFTSPADFDPGAGVYTLTGSPAGRTGFVSKLDGAGNFVWAKAFSSNGTFNSGYSVIVDAAENVYTVGHFQGTTDFDPEVGSHIVTSGGSSDIFIHKMSQCLGVTAATLTTTACNAYTLNNETFTSSGTYTQILTNASGCDSVITLNLTIGGSVKADTITACGAYTWQGQTYSQSGNYALTLTGAGGCDSVLKLKLTVKNQPQITIDTTICEGQNYAGYSSPGTYTNTFIAANGCDSIRTLHLNVKPRLFSIIDATICEGESYLGYISGGTYRDTLTAASGCDSVRTLNLIVNPKRHTAANVSICEGQSYFASGAHQLVTGIYKDTLQSQFGCDSIITTNLTVHPKPRPDLGPDKDLCIGSTLVLSPGNFAAYLWNDQTTDPAFTVTTTGKFWVTVTDSKGCVASDTFTVKNLLPLPGNFLKPSDSVCQYDNLQVAPYAVFLTYQWSTGSRQRTINVQQPGIYYLTVTDNNGCSGKDTILIIGKQCRTGLFVPTGFTPNGDGKNDLFQPRLFGNVKSYQVSVYNRWGNLVFQTTDVGKGWEGKVSGIKQNNGVFIWTCRYQLDGEPQRFEKGTVTVIQ